MTETEAFQRALLSSLDEHEDGDDQLQPSQLALQENISEEQYREKVRLHANCQLSGEERNIVVRRSSIWITEEDAEDHSRGRNMQRI